MRPRLGRARRGSKTPLARPPPSATSAPWLLASARSHQNGPPPCLRRRTCARARSREFTEVARLVPPDSVWPTSRIPGRTASQTSDGLTRHASMRPASREGREPQMIMHSSTINRRCYYCFTSITLSLLRVQPHNTYDTTCISLYMSVI